MVSIKFITRLPAFLIFFTHSFFAFPGVDPSVKKEFSILQKLEATGDYKAGLFYTKNIKKFIDKKSGSQSVEKLRWLSFKLFFENKLDDFQACDLTLKAFEDSYLKLQNTKGTDSHLMLDAFLQVVELQNEIGYYNWYGNHVHYWNKHKDELAEYDKFRLTYYHSLHQYHTGFLNSALKNVGDQISGIRLYLTRSPGEYHEDGYILYANLVKLNNQIYIDQGLPPKAHNLLNEHSPVILQNCKGNRAVSSLFCYLKALNYLSEKDYKKAERYLKKASGIAKAYFLEHTEFVTSIQYNLVKALLAQGKTEEADYYNNNIDVKVIGYFGKKSLSYLHNNYFDIQIKILRQYWEEAEKELEGFLSDPQLPAVHRYREKALRDLYFVSCKRKKYYAADSLLSKLIQLEEKMYGEDSPVIKWTLIDRAYFFAHYPDRFKDAGAIYQKITDKKLLGYCAPTDPRYIDYVINKADLYQYLDDYEKATELYSANLDEVKKYKGTQNKEYTTLLTEAADVYIMSGNYNRALAFCSEALQYLNTTSAKNDTRLQIRTREVMAQLKMDQGFFEEAVAFIEQIISLYEDNVNIYQGEIYISEHIGELYVQAGKYSKGEHFLLKLLQEREALYGPDHKELIYILNYLGELQTLQGNYQEALNYLERSEAIASKVFGESSMPFMYTQIYTKRVLENLGDYKKTHEIMERVMNVFSKVLGHENIKVAMVEHEYVLAAARAGTDKDTALSLDRLHHALKIISETMGSQSPGYALSLENSARYHLLKNNFKDALSQLYNAKSIWKNSLSFENLNGARLTMLLGRVQQKTKDYKDALASFNSAAEMYKSLFSENHPGYIAALGKKAQVQYALDDLAGSVKSIEKCIELRMRFIDNVFPLLSERGKVVFWETAKNDFDFYKNLAFKHNDSYPDMIGTVLNLQIKTRSILLNSQLKIKQKILSSGDEKAVTLYQELLLMRENITKAYSLNPTMRKELGYDLNKMEAAIEKLEKQLSLLSEDFKSLRESNVNYSWKILRKLLKTDEAFVEIVPFRYFSKDFTDTVWYSVLYIDARTRTIKDIGFTTIKDGDFLESRARAYYRNCINLTIRDTSSRNYFWQPIARLIDPEVKQLLMVNDGVYAQINLETIIGFNDEYLINEYNFINILNARTVFARHKFRKEGTSGKDVIYLFGNPKYYSDTTKGNTVSQLPGAEKEIMEIGRLLAENDWATHISLYADATEEKIKALNDPKVIHISTHGSYIPNDVGTDEFNDRFIDNPLLRSYLLFKNGGSVLENNITGINSSPGVLTAFEAMNLSLNKTELVVLSACETGLGEVKVGEGVMGLQNAFLVAGANSVITSQFKANDAITQKLMTEFYTEWLKTGDKHKAFVLAKKRIMETNPSPIFWGVFIMIGLNEN